MVYGGDYHVSPMIRKSVAVGLALLFLLVTGAPVGAASVVTTVPAYAEGEVSWVDWEPEPHQGPFLSQEEALDIFQRTAQLDLDKGRMEAYLQLWGQYPTWEFSYITAAGDRHSHHIGSIHAQTGQLISLDLSRPELFPLKSGPVQSTYPEAFARVWARAKVREVFPMEFATLREAPSGLQPWWLSLGLIDGYSFTFMQYINDTPVPGSSVFISLDKETLRCLFFLSTLHDVVLPDTEPVLSPTEALAIFQEYGLELAYIPSAHMGWAQSDSFVPIWIAYQAESMIDPVTGDLVSYSGEPRQRPGASVPVPANDALALTPGPLPLTPDQALAFAAEVLETPPNAHLSFNSWSGPDQSYYIDWNDDAHHGSLQLHPDTGFIRSAYRSPNHYREEYAEPTEELIAAARNVAVTTIQRLYSKHIHDLRLTQDPSYSPYDFFFKRHVNGIPVEYEGIHVMIDPESLQWTNIHANWTANANFPAPDRIITKAQAERTYFANRVATLIYAEPYFAMPFWPEAPANRTVALVYVLDNMGTIGVDGQTGQLLDMMHRPVNWRSQVAASIAGHWAEHELWFAFQRDALDPLVAAPSTPLTRAGALRLLVAGVDHWSYPMNQQVEVPYVDVTEGTMLYWWVQFALNMGWLVPEGPNPLFNGDQPISRAEFAMMTARVLQLGDLATSSLKTETGYADLARIPREQRNAIAFLEALGIVRTAPNFRPNDTLTQAEGAVMLVRLLNRQWGWQR